MQQPSFRPEDGWPEDDRNQQRWHLERWWLRKLAHVVLRYGVNALLMRVRTSGAEHVPAEGPVIIAANHITNFDVIAMESIVPRHIIYMAKESLYNTRFNDWLIRGLCTFKVRRGTGDRWAMRYARHVLEQGLALGMFIEGTRSKDACLQKGRTGAARLALEANAPIVPLAITGTHRVIKDGLRVPVTLQIGPPVYPQPDDTPFTLTDRVMRAIAAMLPPENRGVYAGPALVPVGD